MKRILIGIGVLISFAVLAQDEDSIRLAKKEERKLLRAQYIQDYPDHFFIWPVIKQRSLSFEMRRDKDRREFLTYKPNNAVSLGVGMYLFELGFELAFAVPIEEKDIEQFGKSSARDLQLNVIGKKWGGDLYYQKYSGFYLTDKDAPAAPGEPFPQRSDITTRNIGISVNYVFRETKFSFRTPFTYADRQLRSNGSWLMFGTVNSFRVHADSAIAPFQYRSELGPASDLKALRYTTLSFAPGYGHNFIYQKFFLNATLSVGPAYHWIEYTRNDGAIRNDDSINSFAALRLGVGYNSDRFFGGVGFITQARNVRFQQMYFSNSTSSFKILVGYRFKEFGILKKRVWDFVPFL